MVWVHVAECTGLNGVGDVAHCVLRTMPGQSGGGYAFRLCKKEGKGSCTEEADFLKLPYLQFVSTKLRWQDGTEENITGTYITDGTYPKGSMWAMNPLPESPTADFPPPCKSGVNPKVRAPMALGKYGYNPGRCAGNWPTTVNIVDTVRIPSDTVPGEYVLSWRWGACLSPFRCLHVTTGIFCTAVLSVSYRSGYALLGPILICLFYCYFVASTQLRLT